ncbi:thiamine phosphate synthase [Marivita sp. XM-24bin2]|jgi:thiamine-phosphate pyrophosphorylase|uniref:thiamine phosphate synthase n=1 Tax=unclassified Marivita TaxID=2632480 RepID=UPI000D78F2D0|nr:thiamine phosphate synthase [Marivita sp. XM-24bin2]MCR9110771.1 thiamine phosphate synthase [Paracoccaceae bacterium]PWL33580.1 MAG: thiamine phosphate synthase [Marivita sp. XM-24bin2]
MELRASQLQLYLVTDPSLCPGPTLLETVVAAVRGGVSFVQLRDKDASTRDRISAARALKGVLRASGVPLVINDDIEAALASDVDGVHIGQSDVAPARARHRLGRDKIIGLSCETPDQVAKADPQTVDYLGLGTVFPTSTKPDHKPTIGLSGLAEMARLARVPTVAIGGLKRAHAEPVLRAGCDGMAVVSAICGQLDPEGAARDLCRALRNTMETP